MTEIYDPTPEIVEEINGLITPKLENPAILDGMAGKFRFYYQDLAKLIDSKNQLLAGPQSSVALLIEKALTLENRLYEASIELQTSQTDLNLVTFRFTEKEQKANFPLPIWIRALGVVTRTPENPLNPFTENFEKARQEQFETEKTLADIEKRAEKEFGGSINRLRASLGQTRNRLVALWEPNLIDDRDLSSEYIRLYISRAEEYTLTWARKHAFEVEFKDRREAFETELIRRYPIEAEKSSFRNHNWVDQFAKDILSKWRS